MIAVGVAEPALAEPEAVPPPEPPERLLALGPLHVSADAVAGAEECARYFPPGYTEPEHKPKPKSRKKKKKRHETKDPDESPEAANGTPEENDADASGDAGGDDGEGGADGDGDEGEGGADEGEGGADEGEAGADDARADKATSPPPAT
ncbi:protein TonB-like [Aricia agestis]|uniref:protein TonB-like n=1 Tax=Aricia agestis TaxID=91739 RepID=UPI001C202DF1|nr:protein TonB-like [Aricia agestis]